MERDVVVRVINGACLFMRSLLSDLMNKHALKNMFLKKPSHTDVPSCSDHVQEIHTKAN